MKHLIVLFLSILTTLAYAQAPQDSSKRTYYLFHSVPGNLMRSFETDRPDLTESPYTVDAGHFQYETDLFIQDRSKVGHVKSVENGFNVANLKLGIANSLDLQFVLTSFASEKTIDEHATLRNSGVGGMTIRAKQNIWGNDKGKTALAILPFVNIPTMASDEKVSGGLIIPFSISLPNEWDIGTQVESDIVEDQTGNGYHLRFSASAATSHSLFGKCNFFLEGAITQDHEVKSYEYFIDGGLVYELRKDLNVDTGIYYGLKSASSKTYFVGLSFRL